jgi:hypothetical protein
MSCAPSSKAQIKAQIKARDPAAVIVRRWRLCRPKHLGMAAATLTTDSPASPQSVAAQIGHWLGTPTWGYLGSSYGFDDRRLLMSPLASGAGQDMERKLRADVPLVGLMPASAVAILAQSKGPDRLLLSVETNSASVQAYIDAGGTTVVSQS